MHANVLLFSCICDFLSSTTSLRDPTTKNKIKSKAFDRFLREAAVMQRLNHPYIIHVFGACSDPSNSFICMELGDLGSLRDLLHGRRGGGDAAADAAALSAATALPALPVSHLLSMFANIASAVAFMHEKGIVHRDIKVSLSGVVLLFRSIDRSRLLFRSPSRRYEWASLAD